MGRAHSPTFPSLHLRHSSFSNPSVTLPTSQLILQPFRCFTYVTVHSPTLLSLLLGHRLFTYVTWRPAHDVKNWWYRRGPVSGKPRTRCWNCFDFFNIITCSKLPLILWRTLFKTLTETRHISQRKAKPLFDSTCYQARKETIQALHKAKGTPSMNDIQNYANKRRDYKQLLMEKKKISFLKLKKVRW